MRSHSLVGVCGILFLIPTTVIAQKCKPTLSGKEKLTKLQMDLWAQDVATTGFLSQVVLEKANVNLNVAIGRVGDANVVRLTLTKEEEPEKVARAVLESQYRAEKGNEFMFGFAQGGTPLRFVASDATSTTEIKGFGPKLSQALLEFGSQFRPDFGQALPQLGAESLEVEIRYFPHSGSIHRRGLFPPREQIVGGLVAQSLVELLEQSRGDRHEALVAAAGTKLKARLGSVGIQALQAVSENHELPLSASSGP